MCIRSHLTGRAVLRSVDSIACLTVARSSGAAERFEAGGDTSSCRRADRRLPARWALTNWVCSQKAILGVTVVAVVLAGSAIVKKACSLIHRLLQLSTPGPPPMLVDVVHNT